MKKSLLLFVALALFTLPAFAQSDEDDSNFVVKERKNAFFLGPKVGATLTSMGDPEECKMADGSGFGFSAGLAAKARFGQASPNSIGGTGYLAVGAEIKYKQNVVKTTATDESGKANANLQVNYFEVPVYVQFYPFVKSSALNALYVEAGVSFAMLMSRSPKTLTADTPNANYSKITYNIDNDGQKLKGGDIRPLVGLGYTIPNTGLDINARYYIGMSDLARNFKSKMNTLEVSISWMFNVSKF